MSITSNEFQKIKKEKRKDLESYHIKVFNFLKENKNTAYTPKEISKALKLNLKKVYKSLEFLDRRKALSKKTPYWKYRYGSKFITKKEFVKRS